MALFTKVLLLHPTAILLVVLDSLVSLDFPPWTFNTAHIVSSRFSHSTLRLGLQTSLWFTLGQCPGGYSKSLMGFTLSGFLLVSAGPICAVELSSWSCLSGMGQL